MPTSRSLDDLAEDYESAELTVLSIFDKPTKRNDLLFAVVELIPPEQPPSCMELPGHNAKVGAASEKLSRDQTLYAARVPVDTVAALAFYRGSGRVRTLTLLDRNVGLEAMEPPPLVVEPPDECAVLVDSNGRGTYSAVLPARPVGVRVCSRFRSGPSLLDRFGGKQKDTIARFGQKTLGIDLVRFSEHLGAIHLAMPNPLLRGWSERLGADSRSILVDFYERRGKTIVGSWLQLTDHRPGGLGFDRLIEVTSPHMLVPVDCDPAQLETRIRNKHGELIEHCQAAFLRSFKFSMGLNTHTRRVQPPTRRPGESSEKVSVYSWEDHITQVGPPATDVSASLLEARARRDEEQSEREQRFWFFDGDPTSRSRARAVVRELIGAARARCLLCDPYLDADDVLEYVTFARTARLEIRLLASAAELRRKDAAGQARGLTLDAKLRALVASDKSLHLACRVLSGRDASPVHDRFLLLDDRVFILGASLNEFGARMTTLSRVPNPRPVIAALEERWNDPQHSVSLADWLGGRVAAPEGGDAE